MKYNITFKTFKTYKFSPLPFNYSLDTFIHFTSFIQLFIDSFTDLNSLAESLAFTDPSNYTQRGTLIHSFIHSQISFSYSKLSDLASLADSLECRDPSNSTQGGTP